MFSSFPPPVVVLLAVWGLWHAVAGQAPAPASPAGGAQTAGEMLEAGQAAYNAGEWKSAVEILTKFLADYGSVAQLEEAVRRVRPLLAQAHLRLEDYGTALPLLEEVLRDPRVDPATRGMLQYSLGVAYVKTSQFDQARRALGAVFTDARAEAAKRADALVLGGMTYLMEGKWDGAVEFFKKYGVLMRQMNPEAAARAEVLNLHALMQAQHWDEALTAGRELHERRDEVRQVVTFHSLLLQLGEHFLEANEPQKAVGALLLVEQRQAMLDTQKAKLEEIQSELGALEGTPATFLRASQLRGTVADVQKELEALEKMPEFDAALRLRLASAFQSANRLREAALILDQMVRQMTPDATVESASASLIRLWMLQERWSRAVRSADLYVERFANFAEKKNLPEVLFLRAQALQGMGNYTGAEEAFAAMARDFPQHELAPRALFMEAYNLLNQERNADAIKRFDKLMSQVTSGEVWEDAFFWKGMALYFDQKWEESRDHFQDYLDRVKRGDPKGGAIGQYAGEAKFRRAYARFSEALYDDATKELEAFLREHAQHDYATEARLTLGDCLAAVGRTTEAVEQYARITPEHMNFFEDAFFKTGKVLQAEERFPEMRAHYETFVREHPKSQRVTEALHWIGWCWKKDGKPEQARDVYWDAIREHGNDPAQVSIEEISTTLSSFYPGAERGQLELQLERERQLATEAGKRALAMRLRWTQAQLIARSKPDESRTLLLKTAGELKVEEDNPRITTDCAQAAFQTGDLKLAQSLFDGVRKWHPRSLWRDQAWAGLGFIALQQEEKARALECFDRFEKITISPKSAPDASGLSLVEGELGGKVTMARAGILAATGQTAQAQALWKTAQKLKSYPARLRAEAFWEMAESLAKGGAHREAVAYYEQIYVLYNRFPDLVARAYLGRGAALEKLGEKEKAREVYSELACRKDLAAEPSSAEGRQRATQLGGVITPPEPPADSLIPPNPAPEAAKKDV